MTDIEFIVSFWILLSGLLLANIANNLADALRARRDLPIGFLPWAINFYIATSVISTLFLLSKADETLSLDMLVLIGLLAALGPYIIVSRLLYPEHKERWDSVEDYYLANRKLILGIMVIGPVVTIFNRFYIDNGLTISEKTLSVLGTLVPVVATFLLLMGTQKRHWHWAGFGFLIAHRILVMTAIAFVIE